MLGAGRAGEMGRAQVNALRQAGCEVEFRETLALSFRAMLSVTSEILMLQCGLHRRLTGLECREQEAGTFRGPAEVPLAARLGLGWTEDSCGGQCETGGTIFFGLPNVDAARNMLLAARHSLVIGHPSEEGAGSCA